MFDLQTLTGFHPLICKRLSDLGIDNERKLQTFLHPELSDLHNPFLMKNMEKAVQRITKAAQNGESVLLYGDYDVDGTTATALMYNFLHEHIEKLNFYVPHRVHEGYGLSEKGVDHAHQIGATLLICLDCGIRGHKQISRAKEKGIDTIVCDHHLPGEVLPQAVVLNPKQADCDYPCQELSGCAIAFKLAQAINQKHSVSNHKLLSLLDLVALSISCDLVELSGENRTLASLGLQQINDENSSLGIQVLINVSKKTIPLSVSDLVFYIGPMINAAGRLSSALEAVALFIETDEAKAYAQADKLFQLNEDRRRMTAGMLDEAQEIWPVESSGNTVLLYKPDWHPGLLGIMAAKATEIYGKPAIAMSIQEGKITGSARSVSGFQLYESLLACDDKLANWGGHAQAAGLTLAEGVSANAFRKTWEEQSSKFVKTEEPEKNLRTVGELKFSEITDDFAAQLKQLAPFGPGNRQPLFTATNVISPNVPKILKGAHLKLNLIQADNPEIVMEAISFYAKADYENWQNRPATIVFAIDQSEWRGRSRLQLELRETRF